MPGMQHHEHYKSYLRAFALSSMGDTPDGLRDDDNAEAQELAATALGIVDGRKSKLATLEEFGDSMIAIFAVRLPLTPAA